MASEIGIVAILWPNERPARVPLPELMEGENPHLRHVVEQMGAYFERRLQRFNVRLDLRGTPFQQKVWGALAEIPHGATRTYGDIARAIGRPSAVRAVGAANGRNPVAIIVPCHRVVGTSGALTGFAGGLETKRYLLNLESVGNTRLL